jgi:3-oxoacyl-(acyl-carrier-protein) synthase
MCHFVGLPCAADFTFATPASLNACLSAAANAAAGLQASEVDYVNAHATSTPAGTLVALLAA